MPDHAPENHSSPLHHRSGNGAYGRGKGREFSFPDLRGRQRHDLRADCDFHNLFNHTNFQGVGTSFATGSTTFGTVTSTRDARVIQMALKVNF